MMKIAGVEKVVNPLLESIKGILTGEATTATYSQATDC
jgi:hypothetical protein